MMGLRKHRVNHIIQTLIYADLLFFLAVGLVTPIVAVFYVNHINGGNVAMVGLVTALFWLVKSVVQIPVSLYADNHKGERDDYLLMVIGYVIIAVVPMIYALWVGEMWQVFLVETLHGIGYGLAIPTYLSIFTRHIDRQRENFEWMLHSNAVGLSYAAAAAIGGVLANQFGFRLMFMATSAFMFLAPIALLFIRNDIRRSDSLINPDPETGLQREKLPFIN
ncbi:MFS transporter [Patescibacteria group bacterium]|nr:MFS transporter [Patescibacteria group bacterium]